MLFEMNTRFQIAAMCCYLVIVIDYIRGQKVNLAASKWFNLMLALTGLYLVFDICSVYTVTYLQDKTINRIIHQLFIGCLDTLILSLSVYVEMLGYRFTNMKKRAVHLWATPYVLSMIMVIVGKLDYFNGEKASYSYGPMAYTVYISVVFYVAFVIYRSFVYKDVIPEKKCKALRLGALIWIIAAIIQLATGYLLLSSLALVMVILVIYLSFENPGENMDFSTGVFNKKAYDSVITERTRFSPQFIIVSMSVQNLNLITNSIGKENTEKLISKFCEYLSDLFHSNCYRTKDNTFTVIVEKEETKLDNKLSILENRMTEPWIIHKNSIKINAFTDVISCPESASTFDEVMNLSSYMYRSHSKTGKKLQYCDETIINEKKRYETVKQIVSNAIQNDGFEVYYQPIYSTEKKRFISAEALVRLKDTQTVGFISPEEFIPISEKSGNILELGSIVFKKVCALALKENLKSLGIEYIEVNLSAIQAIDSDITTQLKEIADSYNIKPEFINLEITETAAVSSGEMLRLNMNKLRDAGFSFSMDDFGTGYSNLSQIAETNYDLVKLDKSLIWPCFGDNNNTKAICLLENVIEMLRSLGIHIVAEGVETEEMAERLAEYKVHYLQGYYYSKPISQDRFVEFIKENNCIDAK